MRVTRYDPWNIINQMNELLNPKLNDSDTSSISTSQWMPAVDIKENQDNYIISADLPGIDKDVIEVSMENNRLTIKGERQATQKEEDEFYSRNERVYGVFHRQFSLPDTADSENISANYTNGVLELVIPKKEVAKPKRINISLKE